MKSAIVGAIVGSLFALVGTYALRHLDKRDAFDAYAAYLNAEVIEANNTLEKLGETTNRGSAFWRDLHQIDIPVERISQLPPVWLDEAGYRQKRLFALRGTRDSLVIDPSNAKMLERYERLLKEYREFCLKMMRGEQQYHMPKPSLGEAPKAEQTDL